jgi:dipeptidyl aminopeptidase/acylaminoacyl peptidase
VLNIWVAPAGDPAAAKPLTAEKTRPIRSYYWSPDSKAILFVNDKGGDENFLLYGVDVATATQKSLTPFDKTRVEVINISHAVKDRILLGINNRDARWHDVYSLDLASGKLTLVLQNDGDYAGFVADEQLVPRLASKQTPDGGQAFFRIANGKVETTPFATIGLDDSLTTAPSGFTTDGKTLYWLDSRGRDTAALIAQDVASGRQTVVAQDPYALGRRAGDLLFDPDPEPRSVVLPTRLIVRGSGEIPAV